MVGDGKVSLLIERKAVYFRPQAVKRSVFREEFFLVAGLALIAFLSVYHLQGYPRTWFDEGLNLEVAKNLAIHGQYSRTISSQPVAEWTITTGPTVIVPIALFFRVLGVTLVNARLVMAAYTLATAVGLYAFTGQLYGRRSAIVSVLVLAALGSGGVFANGRYALGEVPAMCFVFWGSALLVSAERTRSFVQLFASGLVFGLAILTKAQFFLMLPAVAAAQLLVFHVSRRIRREHFTGLLAIVVGACLPSAVWYGYQYRSVGRVVFLSEARQYLALGASTHVPVLARLPSAVGFLVASGFLFTGACGLLYIYVRAMRDRARMTIGSVFLPSFTSVWLVWYLTMSIGWPRYAVPLEVGCVPFVAKLIVDVTWTGTMTSMEMSARDHRRLPSGNSQFPIITFLFVGIILTGIIGNVAAILKAHDDSPQVFASIVEATVPAAAHVEATDWEIIFLTDRIYDHPDDSVIVRAINQTFLSEPNSPSAQYLLPPSSAYLVDGPFSKASGIYKRSIDSGRARLIASVGDYNLYQVTSPTASSRARGSVVR